jgi:hypothetical protein
VFLCLKRENGFFFGCYAGGLSRQEARLKNVIISLVLFSLPVIAQANDRPVFLGEHVPQNVGIIFQTPEHRRHAIGIYQSQDQSFVSREDAVAVTTAPLQPLVFDEEHAKRLAYSRYCNLGEDMTDDDWRIITATNHDIPDDLEPGCKPPK